MQGSRIVAAAAVVAAIGAGLGLGFVSCARAQDPHAGHAHTAPAAAPLQYAIAVLAPTAGNTCHGVVRFSEAKGGVLVVADIEGLTPGQQHAFHIHEFGDCSAPDATSAGSHYNPEGHPHGLPSTDNRHAGDMGNLQADKDGKVHMEMTLEGVTLNGAMDPIIGRGVIVHAKPDDGGQPVGNAGGRIACGVIGAMKAPETK